MTEVVLEPNCRFMMDQTDGKGVGIVQWKIFLVLSPADICVALLF